MSFLAGVAFNGMQAFMYAVAAHSYPTEIRGSAVGLAQTVSRIGAVLEPDRRVQRISRCSRCRA